MNLQIIKVKLANKFEVDYNLELKKLNKYIKLAKQYIYDNSDKLENYITYLEDMVDNLKRKICSPYPYKINSRINKKFSG